MKNFSKTFLHACTRIVWAFFSLSMGFSGDVPVWLAEKHRGNSEPIEVLNDFVRHTASCPPIIVPFKLKEVDGVPQHLQFGNTFPTKPDLEGPFLEFVSESTDEKVYTIEVACSFAGVSLKVPFCFQKEGLHIGIDLSREAIKIAQKKSKALLPQFGLQNSCHLKKCNFHNIFKLAPKYKGKMKALYSQCYIHYCNPKQVHEFFSTTEELLIVGGKAFINGVVPNMPAEIDCYNTAEQDYSNTFPGFFEVSCGQFKQASPDSVFDPVVTASGKKGPSIINLFTPEVFRRVMQKHPNLEIVDTYFTDKNGRRLPEMKSLTISESRQAFAAVIVQKR